MDGKKLVVFAGPLLILGGSALKKPEQTPLRLVLVAAGTLSMLYGCCREAGFVK